MVYAINIADLAKFKNEFPLMLMLKPHIYNEHAVSDIRKCEGERMDGGGAVLHCGEEQAKAIIDVIRMKIPKHELRAYESKTGKGGWKRI